VSSVALAQVPQPFNFDWRNLKDIWEHPRLEPTVQNFQSRFGINLRTNATNLRGVVGGNYARLGQFPFHVLTVIDDMWWCGSSLLNANWALTAGHCIYLSQYATVYSINDLNQGYFWTSNSAQLILHENYDDYEIVNDIGLIRLATPATETQYTSFITLPHNYNGNNFAGYVATVQGFGVYSDAVGQVSEVKRYVSQNIMANAACYWNPPANQLCTDTTAGGGPCNGDSGGALFTGNRENHGPDRTIVGIVSYGALAGCQLGYPAAFTRVTSFLDWIDRHIAV